MRRIALIALLIAGCGEEPAGIEIQAEIESDADREPGAAELPAGEATWSNARGFYAVWRPLDGEIPFNEEFDAEVWLYADDSGAQPIEDANVAIDCRMPHHQHGMLHDVDLVPTGGGRYLAEGMLCHMLGYWELHVDVTRGAVTERAQFALEVE